LDGSYKEVAVAGLPVAPQLAHASPTFESSHIQADCIHFSSRWTQIEYPKTGKITAIPDVNFKL
jgi:hypothetical protein